jgi:hypothetical protein
MQAEQMALADQVADVTEQLRDVADEIDANQIYLRGVNPVIAGIDRKVTALATDMADTKMIVQ